MKYWHYLQFATGDEGLFTQNHRYKLSANSSYCVWSTHLPHTICSLNLKSCDPLQFHFSFPLLDLFIFLRSHLKLHMDCLHTFSWFILFLSFFLLCNLCSCLKANSFHLNLFVSSQCFLNPDLSLSGCLFIYFFFCFVLKFPELSLFQIIKKKKKRAPLLVLCLVSLNGR